MDATESKINQQIEALKQALKSGLITNAKDKADAQEVLDAYEQTLQTIELLKNSDNKYRIEVKPNFDGDSTKNSGELTYDKNTGEFVITVEGTDQSHLPMLAHELEHANQLENGELYLQNGDIAGYDINDEVDAYNIQHKFDFGIGFDVYDLNGNPVTDGPYEVTADEVYNQFPGVYDHLKYSNSGGNNDPEGSASSSGSHP